MRQIDEIIIHCSATRPDWFAGRPVNEAVSEIDRWHRDRGFSEIGYHFVIDRKGETGIGRSVARTGAHTLGHNTGTIGVCLLGGHGAAATDEFEDHFTKEQDAELRELLDILKAEHPGIKKITGHNDYANKGCPGFKVSEWLIRKPIVPAPVVPRMTFWESIKFFFGIK